jgi:hypothetical protein
MDVDVEILEYLRNLKLRGVSHLYCNYGFGMFIVANRMLENIDQAKDIVYDTFWKLWFEKKFSDVAPPLRPFLYQEIIKACATKEASLKR